MASATALEITVLREDTTTRDDLSAGHGLSLLTRPRTGTFLLDTGESDETWANADALGVDLAQIDAVVLSHGHYDHTGGLPGLLERIGALHIIAHPAVFEPRWSEHGGHHPIGPPLTRAQVEATGSWLELSAEPIPVAPGVRTTGQVPRHAGPIPPVGGGTPSLLVERDGRRIVDDFVDDISVIADVGAATVVLTGCAHAGLINIVARATELAGRCPVAIIGGTHLAWAPEDEVAAIAADLHQRGVRTLVPMHCTGERGAALLERHFSGEVLRAGTGSVITVAEDGSLTIRTP